MDSIVTFDMSNFVQFTPEQLNLSSGIPLGSGAISNVLQSTLAPPLSIPVAVKIYSKIQLLQLHKVESVLNEKKALLRLQPHPYICRLYGTAQSVDELYSVLELLPNGDLLQHIRRTAAKRLQGYVRGQPLSAGSAPAPNQIPLSSTAQRCLGFHDLQLITSQLLLALSHVFKKGLVLRDLKPENVAFDRKWRACLIDFDTVDLEGEAAKPHTNHGIALPKKRLSVGSVASAREPPEAVEGKRPRRSIRVSEIQAMRKRTASFCGTAQYVSPEMVGECRWSFSSDLWALGTVVYEMLYGVHMFAGMTAFKVMQKVIQGIAAGGGGEATVPFPMVDFADDGAEGALPDAFARVKDFILRLVDIDPYKRLGVNPETHEFDLEALKKHILFSDFDWSVVENQVQSFKQRVFAMGRAGDDVNGTATPSVVPDPDPSPSLKSLYHDVPYNDQRYADYVYSASSDANPFERYLQCMGFTDKIEDTRGTADDISYLPNDKLRSDPTSIAAASSRNGEVLEERSRLTTDCTSDGKMIDDPNAVKQTSCFERTSTGSCRSRSIDTDDESIEIIDDVGMNFRALALGPVFGE